MNIFWISNLLVAITNFGIATFVLLRDWKNPVNRTFSGTAISICVWGVGGLFFSCLPENQYKLALLGEQIAYIGVIFIPVFYTHFVTKYLNRDRKFIIVSFYFLGVVFLILVWFKPSLFLGELRFMFNQFYYVDWRISKNLSYLLFYIYFYWFLLGYCFFLLIKKYLHTHTKEIEKNQLKYCILGSAIGWLGAHGVCLPKFGVNIYPCSNFLIAIYPFIITYAIIKYRLMDIQIAIKKTSLLTVGVLIPVIGAIACINLLQSQFTKILGQNWWLFPSIITVFLTLGLFKFVGYVVRLKDEELYKERFQYRQVLRKHAEQIAKAKTIRELSTYTVRHISNVAKLDFVAIALKKEKEIPSDVLIKILVYYIIERVADRTGRHLSSLKGRRIESGSNLILYLKQKNTPKPLEKDYLYHILNLNPSIPQKTLYTAVLKEIEDLGCDLVFPAFSGQDLVGLLFLGKKLNGSIYSKEDLELFSFLANEAAKPISEIMAREEIIEIILASCHSNLNALERRDQYTRGHTERVKEFCLKIAKDEIIKTQLERIADGVWGLELAAQLHDLGKIGIPDNVLNKQGRLTEEEFSNFIAGHPREALSIIGNLSRWLKDDIISGILQHQEHYDGTGYPQGLKANSIHLYARIIHLADALDAMTSKRPYREALSIEKAIEEIKRNSGSQFDPLIAGVVVKLHLEGKL